MGERPAGRRDLDELEIGGIPLRWEELPVAESGEDGWMHSGVAVLPDGEIVVAHPRGHAFVAISRDGARRTVPVPLSELHGIAVGTRDGRPLVWAADPGTRMERAGSRFEVVPAPGRAAAVDLDGRIVIELEPPAPHPDWNPTTVSLADPADPRSDVWIGDGYGHSLVHRFDADGRHLLTIDGSDTGTAFDCPHGILVRGRGDTAEVYVADRSNKRIVVYGVDGTLHRVLGEDALDSPSAFAVLGEHLVVTELLGSLAVFGPDDAYIGHLGASRRTTAEPEWPNAAGLEGGVVRPDLHPGEFNSPHGIGVQDGAIVVAEWLSGGRLVRLTPTA
jgi:hypothetical protein